MATPLPTGLTWRKSSYSTDNGVCVEIAHLPGGRLAIRDSKNPSAGHLIFPGLTWRKSSFSTDNGMCVELAHLPGGRLAIRDSKNPAAGQLIIAGPVPSAWFRG